MRQSRKGSASQLRYTVAEMCEALRKNRGVMSAAARDLKCNRLTVLNYVHRFPEVREVCDDARELAIDRAEIRLWEQVEKGEGWAITLLLKTVGKNRGYIERQEWSGVDGEPIRTETTIDLKSLSDQELEVLSGIVKRTSRAGRNTRRTGET